MWMLPEVKGAEGLMYLRGCPSVEGARRAERVARAPGRLPAGLDRLRVIALGKLVGHLNRAYPRA